MRGGSRWTSEHFGEGPSRRNPRNGPRNGHARRERREQELVQLQDALQRMLERCEHLLDEAEGPLAAFVWRAPIDEAQQCEDSGGADAALSVEQPEANAASGLIDYFIMNGSQVHSPQPLGQLHVPTDRPIRCVPLDALLRKRGFLRSLALQRIARELVEEGQGPGIRD